MKFKKKMVFLIGLSIIIILGVIVSINKLSQKPKLGTEIVPTPTEALPTVNSSVQIDLSPRFDKKAVELKITNIPSNVDTLEYELTYNTASGLPRGVLGKIDLKGETSLLRDITLGTCSRGKCVYDEGVNTVDLSLKFNSSRGSSVFQKQYQL